TASARSGRGSKTATREPKEAKSRSHDSPMVPAPITATRDGTSGSGDPAPTAGDPAPTAGDPAPTAGDPALTMGDPGPAVGDELRSRDDSGFWGVGSIPPRYVPCVHSTSGACTSRPGRAQSPGTRPAAVHRWHNEVMETHIT